jgi:High potential iron-sulfur protein
VHHRSRRKFMFQVAAGGLVLNTAALAQTAGPKLEESDPQAVALGYKQDTTKVDAKKYPNHALSQTCASCQLYQGKPKEALGPCPLFGAKQVTAGGWCSAWAKKAA